jgi:hypothetical protein
LLNKINKDKVLKIPTKITQTNVLNGLLAIQTTKTKLNHALAKDVLMSKQMEMIAINVLLAKITKKMMEIKLKDNPALVLAALLQTPMTAKFVLLITPMLLLKMDNNNNKLANLPTQTPGTDVLLVTRTLEIKLKDSNKLVNLPTQTPGTHVPLVIRTLEIKLKDNNKLANLPTQTLVTNDLLVIKKILEIKLKDNPALVLAALLQTPMIAKFVLLVTRTLEIKLKDNNKLANLPTQTPGTDVLLVTRTLEIKLKDNNKLVNLPTQTLVTNDLLVIKKILEIKLMANPALVLAALLQTPMIAKFVLLITPMLLLRMDSNNKLANLPTQTPGTDVPLVIRIPKPKRMVNHVPVLTVLM